MMIKARRVALLSAGVAGSLALAACGGGGFSSSTTSTAASGGSSSGPVTLKMLVGVSGDSELAAVKSATDAWATKSGNKVEVTNSAKLTEEIAKGFAGGSPADLMYVSPDQVANYSSAGNLFAYGDQVASMGFSDSLKQAFTVDGKFVCAPKDFSTLALVINSDLWTKAGLTDADIPKDWAGLETVAKKLTSGTVTGLVATPEYQRLGTFMAQAGGSLLSADGKTATVNSAENVAGLTEAQKMLKAGTMKFAKQVDAGWGGEALIKGKAAMVIEGNWIHGALTKDAPNLKVKVAELPAGPKGKGTLQFTNCWGIAAKSANQAAAVDLVKTLLDADNQLTMSKGFGVMPSTSAGLDKFKAQFPEDAAFVSSADFAQSIPNNKGFDKVLSDLNSSLESLATGDPKKILDTAQANATAVVGG